MQKMSLQTSVAAYAGEELFEVFLSGTFCSQLKDFCSWCAESSVLVFKYCTTVKFLKSKHREMAVQNQFCLAVLVRTLNIKREIVLC